MGSLKTNRLSRLRDALRTRDWLGITIELVVVTVGVLLAFQIDQWGDQRKQAQEEHRFLVRLYTEYQRGIAELDDVDEDSRRIRQQVSDALAARDDPVRLEFLAREGFGCGAARFRNANFNDTSFEELVSSGRINLISDQALRSEVRDLAASQATASKQVEYARQLMLQQLAYLDDYYRFDLDRDDGRESCRLDWPALIKDRKAVNAMVRARRVHGFVMEERQKVRARSQALIRRLACEVGKPECSKGS